MTRTDDFPNTAIGLSKERVGGGREKERTTRWIKRERVQCEKRTGKWRQGEAAQEKQEEDEASEQRVGKAKHSSGKVKWKLIFEWGGKAPIESMNAKQTKPSRDEEVAKEDFWKMWDQIWRLDTQNWLIT